MKKVQITEDVLENRVLRIFHEINQIPRGSFHEEKISEYLVNWAKERELFVIQDSLKNVLIRKAATKGYEQAKGVLLQAHMDMVCEKVPESTHDFSKDPIPWVVEDDFITTGGQTTLGADDGIGMALAMAALEEEDWEHPLLEVLFTVSEEEDLGGAIGFDTSLLQSSYLINLDHVDDHEILCGSCGGEAVDVDLEAKWEKIPENWGTYCLEVRGLKGGHSGEDIDKGHGNANRIWARCLLELEKQMEVRLCSLTGGSFRLAISREAVSVVALPREKAEEAKNIMDHLQKILREEYQAAGETLELVFTENKEACDHMSDAHIFLTMILLSPDGIWEMNPDMEHLVNSSDNLGELYLDEKGYRLIYEIRSAHNSARDHIADVIKRLAEMMGASWKIHSGYPSWAYHPKSVLRDTAIEAFEEMNGETPKVYSVHAGLECGCFFAAKPDLDAISIGPNCWGLHSPEEKLSISSTKHVYEILRRILLKLH